MSKASHEKDIKIGHKKIVTNPKKEDKPLDIAFDNMMKANAENNVFLDAKLREVEKLDRNITFHENKIKYWEEEKQKKIREMSDLLELAVKSSHILRNGYYIKPDDKRKINVKDVPEFLKWLKKNKQPKEVLEFFNDALKVTKLKDFCNKEANNQRENGIINPKIDGIDFGEVTFTRFTTGYKENKK